MTPRISLITAVAAAALVVAVPAAFADNWGADRHDGAAVVGSPDLVDRVVAAKQKELTTMLDAREKSFTEKRNVQPASGSQPDAFERAVAARETGSVDHFIANDNRFRVTPANDPGTVSATGSGTDIEWPQIGFGALIGILFALGLMLVLRTARSRELAH